MAAAEIEIKLTNGAKAGDTLKELTKQANTLNKEIKNLKPGTQEFIDKAKDLEAVNGKMGDIKKQIKEVTTASDFLKQAWNKLPGAQYFNQIGESFGIMKKGVGGLISSFGVLKTAIASTGIGLLVLLVSSLVTWFTKTEEGADKLKSVLYPLQVLFQKLTGILADLGGKVFKRLEEAFKNPVQAIKDLGQAIYDNIIARFEALTKFAPAIVKIFSGDIKAGFKDLGNAAIQLGTGFENVIDKAIEAGGKIGDVWDQAAADGKKLLDLENAIEDAESALVVTRAKLNVEAAKAMELSKDITKSDEERVAAAKRFSEIIDQQTAAEENFLKLKQQRLILEQDIDGILNDDEKLARAQMEADLIQLQADNIDKKKKAKALELSLSEEIANREIEIATNTAQLKAQAYKDGLDQEIAQIQQQTEQKISALKGSDQQVAEQRTLLLEIQEQQLAAVRKKYSDQKAAEDQKAIEEDEKRRKEAANKELAEIQRNSDRKNFILLQQLSEGEITRKEFDEMAEENQIAAWEEQLVALEEQGLKESELYAQIAGKIIDIEERKQAKLKHDREAAFNATVTLANSILQNEIDNLDRENEIGEQRLADIEARYGKESSQYATAQAQLLSVQRANFEKKKKLEKSQVMINALAEIAGIIKSAVEMGGIYGLIVGAALSAVTLIRAKSAIKDIDAQKFEKGGIPDGILRGPSHAQGGIPLEAEGDEIILTKGVYRNPRLRAAASAINVAGGGRKFATGGPASPFKDRAAIPSSAQSSNSVNDSNRMLESKLDGLIASVDKFSQWPNTLKVVNVATETQAVNDKVKMIQNQADV